VFNADIKNLLIMADMWKSRAPPTPLDYDTILDGTFQPSRAHASAISSNGSTSKSGANGAAAQATTSASTLKDQRALSLKDNLELFISRYLN
jgi:ubiquitin-like 1-activating enzyme E1 B